MSLKPWREVIFPHEDVLKGTFQQAEFAADITSVHEGQASPDYLEPSLFFERTFITEGMRLLLHSVLKRLSGQGGDPVIQLQTAFGGGKTHTLLAVYHLVSGQAPASKMLGIPDLLDAAGLLEAPRARIVVLDGTKFSPNQPARRGQEQIRTIWGELAWQLGGSEAYAQVAEADASGTAPGKEVLRPLLQVHAPCVILIDELVAYIRQFEEGKHLTGGSFDSNLSFVQNLTESIKGVPTAVLLASLPESDKEAGSQRGIMTLGALAHCFGRVQALWKPVAAEEAFEIVRRRLFSSAHDQDGAKAACRAFADLYTNNTDEFPIETQDVRYRMRLEQAYPIHPEVFDRLYEDWSTLDTFQRTRGVLKLLAKVIHRLWKDGNNDPMIMPGSLPLYDPDVRNEMVYYLPAGWDPVIEKDIDDNNAETTGQDTTDTRLGAVQACRRTARTVFLGSAPDSGLLPGGSGRRGLEQRRIMLGSALPEHQVGLFRDALRRLVQHLHYLNSVDSRYWFDTRPNLRREMEERKRRYQREDIFPIIRARLQEDSHGSLFAGVHIFTPSQDIPDDEALRLVVLDPEKAYSRNGHNRAYAAALGILENRGEQPRLNRNRLLFLAADFGGTSRLIDQVRTVLAWKSIEDDIRGQRLNLDQHQSSQARQLNSTAQEILRRMVAEVYKWFISPKQTASTGAVSKIELESFSLNTAAQSLPQAMEQVARDSELVISKWAPKHLHNLLRHWFWKSDSPDMFSREVWQHICRQVYMPRLRTKNVFIDTIQDGSESGEFFGLAQGKEGARYLGFSFGAAVSSPIDAVEIFIEPTVATAYKAKLDEEKRRIEEPERPGAERPEPHSPGSSGMEPVGHAWSVKMAEIRPKKRFYAAIDLEPHGPKLRFNDIVDHIIQNLVERSNISVTISIEIQAETNSAFKEDIQRILKENCKTLGFRTCEFED